jgi:hypothetical protein
MSWFRKLSARFGDQEWVFLTEMPGSRWRLLLWGPYPRPVEGEIRAKSEDEAKRVVLEIVRAHLAALGRISDRARLSTLPWQVAVWRS